jgi:hypothetical protein
MDHLPDGIVLDEAASPGDTLELVAYEAEGIVWMGVRPKESPLKGAFGLHSGSNKEHYLEVTGEIHGTWGVAYGAVSPQIERVEVCNERGESFPGRIVPLPVDFEEEYRAAWGVATECRKECTLIGYDDRGRLIDSSMIRPRRRDLSAEETLELIRAHCDNGLRYLTWALKRMPSIPEQAGHLREVQNYRRAHAHVLAYVEGADDERSASSAVGSIVQRYIATIEAEGWEPPFGSRADRSEDRE